MIAIQRDDAVDRWLIELEARHLANLTFQEVSRALRALSSTYVERRRKLAEGAALAGAGKRAAFALFYAPLHYLLVDRIVAELVVSPPANEHANATLVDLGCGTGAAGAAWAGASRSIRRVVGVDRNTWALGEAARTYRHFGLARETRREDAAAFRIEKARAIVAAFTVNELDDTARAALLPRLLERARAGASILIVEPLAKSATPWWGRWRAAFEEAGGRGDEWRFRAELPPLVAKLDRAAGLDHRELTGRSLWIAPPPTRAAVPDPSS